MRIQVMERIVVNPAVVPMDSDVQIRSRRIGFIVAFFAFSRELIGFAGV